MKDYTIKELQKDLYSHTVSCEQVVREYIERIKLSKTNAVIEIFADAIENAKIMDGKIASSFKGKLAGIPVLIKDNILMKGKIASAGSRMLKNYMANYSATVVEKLLNEGAIILGRTNMDEFAMGSGTETSFYGATLNPLDNTRVPGGSSGGSACAVKENLCVFALGTDTGGSIRQPSSFCGVVGIKPTYGLVSRYGVIAYASSLEQVGPITKTVEDNAIVLEVIAGGDSCDETSIKNHICNFDNIESDVDNLKIGVIQSVDEMVETLDCKETYLQTIEFLKSKGAKIVHVQIDDMALALPSYYIIAPAEATSNLSRFDGVKYTTRDETATNLKEIYKKTRTNCFGREVKRRIMLGNFVLSSGYFDAFYNKAKSVQAKLTNEYLKVLENVDVILMPTTLGEAYKLNSKNNPVDAYKEDIFTVTANVTGLPCISVPCGKGKNGLPIGMQFMAKSLDENTLYRLASCVEKYKEIK